ncbi:hypothetical protein ACHHYP_15042 [Achlya hypogyna]|uniref:WW domain-containing protein n=1 Tax=Achlya hypogyna TaxID=1202772 RepID=A0A1V9YBN1_ACHHY|nr:hypothetical protein ACHHYP_15042 [Achlya hypogyna]
MHRVNRKCFGGFDERNAGGREQTAMELKRFQAVISKTKFHPSTTSHIVSPRPTPRTISPNVPPPPHFPPGFEQDSTIEMRWKASPYKERKEFRDHAKRLAYINQHIVEYNAKTTARLVAGSPRTDFPAMHPETRKHSHVRTCVATESHKGLPAHPSPPQSPRKAHTAAVTVSPASDFSKACAAPRRPMSSGAAYRSRLLAFVEQARVEIHGELRLPDGWESATDAKGRRFYIDHNTERTTWDPPINA